MMKIEDMNMILEKEAITHRAIEKKKDIIMTNIEIITQIIEDLMMTAIQEIKMSMPELTSKITIDHQTTDMKIIPERIIKTIDLMIMINQESGITGDQVVIDTKEKNGIREDQMTMIKEY